MSDDIRRVDPSADISICYRADSHLLSAFASSKAARSIARLVGDSHCVSIREPFGISVRQVFGQLSVPLRPPSGNALTQETTNMFDRITGHRFGRCLVLASITAGSTLIGVSVAAA